MNTMRKAGRIRLGIIAAASALALTLAGCGNSDAPAPANNAASSSDSSWPAADGMPAVEGKFGEKPKISKGEGTAPTELKSRVLVAGNGQEVKADDMVTVNYLGQTWEGTEFDTSFGRQVATFSLQQVVKGWTQGLTGKKVGDRVELVIPPALGYGEQAAGSIPPNSTLVFVVDIIGALSPSDYTALKDAKPVANPKLPEGLKVSGELGAKPNIEVTTAAAPTKTDRVILAQGAGKPIDANDQLLLHVTTYNYETKKVGSSWDSGPAQLLPQPVGAHPELIAMFTGVPVGTRYVYFKPQTPKTAESEGNSAQILVIDVVGSVATKS